MFERPQSDRERAILVHIQFKHDPQAADFVEFQELTRSADVEAVLLITGRRQNPDAGHFVGKGKLDDIAHCLAQTEADVVLFNRSLTPAQERNLERQLHCRVLDRTGLILAIFAQRARSFEGKLQVELARLQHLSTRLVRGWTHLERQKGVIGLRGPGETQLETDRRLLGDRIKQILKRLDKVRQQREQSRKARQKALLPTVSLVGYTNAGKSTLFNQLTQSIVYAADQLFATLDPTLRRLSLPNKSQMILADTVGFIQNLPHDLVAAFKSTLDETAQARLLLHVVDAHDNERLLRINQVNQVLKEIGADGLQQILVYNKIDLLPDTPPRVEYDSQGQINKVWLSASENLGLDLLQQAVSQVLQQAVQTYRFKIPVNQGQVRAKLYEIAVIMEEQFNEAGDCFLTVSMETHAFKAFADYAI